MPLSSSQSFLKELDKELWTAAGLLRAKLDAAVYKCVSESVPGFNLCPQQMVA